MATMSLSKKWGRRKLEENWRRKNKNSISTDEILDANAAADTAATDTKKPEEAEAKTLEEKLLASIPTTPEKLAKSNDLLVDAYYNAGVIYKDGLENYPKAENMFETANSRFPKHKLLLESYYNLYLIAQKRDQKTKAETYKQKILNEFPESVIAKFFATPIISTKRTSSSWRCSLTTKARMKIIKTTVLTQRGTRRK
jgi:tetratricopeptide (TPR) repeat protein